MNANIATLQRLLFADNDVSGNALKTLVEKYPFYQAARMLHLAKQQEEAALTAEQQQELALFFPDKAWVNFLLRKEQQQPATTIAEPAIEKEVETSVVIETPEAAASTETTEAEIKTETPPPATDQPKLVIPADAVLTFEPFHTVDYFASQGIKFKDDDKPKDKFGQQLRSFTEWLKTMKKIPAVQMEQLGGKQEEQKVEKMAEQSLSERDVVTEAMAEVWEKQGNQHKAIDIYQKLSLLNPSKSSYFAAKIDQLKQL